MNDKPNRRILDRPTGSLSLLATGSRVTGDIETPGALMIGCHVLRRRQHRRRTVGVGRGALGRRRACAQRGGRRPHHRQHRGAQENRDRRQRGDPRRVIAGSIAMARGATIDGEVTVTGDQPILEFEEKRAPAGAAQTR
jgi:hypothetical protein